MSEWSMPFADQDPDDEDGRPYTDAEIRQMHRALFLQDDEANAFLLEGAGNEMAVTAPSANTIRVNTGAATVDGFFYINDASNDLSANSAAAGQSRRDRVIIKADWAAFKCRLALKEGTTSTVPSLTQTRNTVWEMSLAWYDIDDAGAITNLTSEVTDASMAHFATRVSSDMIDGKAVTAAKLAADVAGDGLEGADGSALAVKVDGSTIEISGDTLKVVGGEASIRIIGEITQNAAATLGGSDGRRMVVSGTTYESWVHCDGGASVNGVTIPDIQDRVIAGASGSHATGTTGGADAADLTHNHGATGLSMTTVGNHRHGWDTPIDVMDGTDHSVAHIGGDTTYAGDHYHTMQGQTANQSGQSAVDIRQKTIYLYTFIYVGT